VAYLCIGYVNEFSDKPDLEKSGWLKRINLNEVIFYETWDHQNDSTWSEFCNAVDRVEPK
jgi:5,6-dimethylbenzimidazole synthase